MMGPSFLLPNGFYRTQYGYEKGEMHGKTKKIKKNRTSSHVEYT